MKNLLLLAGSLLVFSCATNDDLNESVNTEQLNAKTNLQGAKLSNGLPDITEPLEPFDPDIATYKCNGPIDMSNPINLNPNYPYISTYEVLHYDNTPMWGRNQIRLSEFVALNIFGYGTWQQLVPIYIGYGTLGQFNSFYVPNSTTAVFSFGQHANNAADHGDIFGDPANWISMTLDGANTVYHIFNAAVLNLISQGKQIKAVHLSTDSYLCGGGVKGITMTIKYI